MNKVRFFIFITFTDNNVLIDFLRLVTEKIGKYDFFTQNIKNPFDLSGNFSANSGLKIKAVSLKKLYPIDKCRTFVKRSGEIDDKLQSLGHGQFRLTCGYVNHYQVVTLYDSPGPERVYMSKNLFAQVQLVHNNGHMVSPKGDGREFTIADMKKYFEDLHSLYREQTAKGS